jgi:hypothetical protein
MRNPFRMAERLMTTDARYRLLAVVDGSQFIPWPSSSTG